MGLCSMRRKNMRLERNFWKICMHAIESFRPKLKLSSTISAATLRLKQHRAEVTKTSSLQNNGSVMACCDTTLCYNKLQQTHTMASPSNNKQTQKHNQAKPEPQLPENQFNNIAATNREFRNYCNRFLCTLSQPNTILTQATRSSRMQIRNFDNQNISCNLPQPLMLQTCKRKKAMKLATWTHSWVPFCTALASICAGRQPWTLPFNGTCN